jgi:hypothetical protein
MRRSTSWRQRRLAIDLERQTKDAEAQILRAIEQI